MRMEHDKNTQSFSSCCASLFDSNFHRRYAFCITGEMTDSSTHAMYHLKKTQDITICETAFFKLGQKTNGNV